MDHKVKCLNNRMLVLKKYKRLELQLKKSGIVISDSRIILASVHFLIALFMKQFYLRDSGSIQIGDAIFALTALLVFTSGQVRLQDDSPLALFVLFSFVINGFYSLYYKRNIMISSIYLFYNLIVILSFRVLIQNERFLKWLINVLKLILLAQLFFYFTDLGKHYAGSRYQGTFNDPNQYGFFVLCSFILLYLSCIYFKKRPSVIWFVISGFLIILSSSRGMLVSYAVLLFLSVLLPYISEKNFVIKSAFSLAFVILLFVIFVFNDLLSALFQGFLEWRYIASVIGRFQNTTTANTGQSVIYNLLIDRQLVRVIKAPYYLLFGSGEGINNRFLAVAGQSGEIHCTMIALCYYYGIIPYTMFLKWIRNNTKNLPLEAKGAFVALILEAFTLANHRQPLFWVIFVFGSILVKTDLGSERKKRREYKVQHNSTYF